MPGLKVSEKYIGFPNGRFTMKIENDLVVKKTNIAAHSPSYDFSPIPFKA